MSLQKILAFFILYLLSKFIFIFQGFYNENVLFKKKNFFLNKNKQSTKVCCRLWQKAYSTLSLSLNEEIKSGPNAGSSYYVDSNKYTLERRWGKIRIQVLISGGELPIFFLIFSDLDSKQSTKQKMGTRVQWKLQEKSPYFFFSPTCLYTFVPRLSRSSGCTSNPKYLRYWRREEVWPKTSTVFLLSLCSQLGASEVLAE